MKNTVYSLLSSALVFMLPLISNAGGLVDGDVDASSNRISETLAAILTFINSILLPLILGIAFIVFVWGVFKYFVLGGADEEKQTEGKNLVIYSVIGFVIIVSFYGLINLVASGIGATDGTLNNIPSVPSEIE